MRRRGVVQVRRRVVSAPSGTATRIATANRKQKYRLRRLVRCFLFLGALAATTAHAVEIEVDPGTPGGPADDLPMVLIAGVENDITFTGGKSLTVEGTDPVLSFIIKTDLGSGGPRSFNGHLQDQQGTEIPGTNFEGAVEGDAVTVPLAPGTVWYGIRLVGVFNPELHLMSWLGTFPTVVAGSGTTTSTTSTTTTSTTTTTVGVTTTTGGFTTTTGPTTTTSLPGVPDCSQPLSSGDQPTATDCLFILNVSVGLEVCEPDPCICTPSGDPPVSATDSLVCLNAAIDLPVELLCPCGTTTTTTLVL
jgi:hypothetical protein